MADLTFCDACGQEHPGAADEWGVYRAPNGSGGLRERLLCPPCASAVTALFGSRGARLEAATPSAPTMSPPAVKPRKARAGSRRATRGSKTRKGQKR